MSHDLRVLLKLANGFAHVLEEDYTDKFDLNGVKSFHSIIRNSSRMGILIDDLLLFFQTR